MSKLLSDHGAIIYSQYGEDGIIQAVFDKIGVVHRRCGEVGASDGRSLSNTAHLWKDLGWDAVLIEADDARFFELSSFVDPNRCETHHLGLTPDNINEVFSGEFDFLSIDVDGDDYFLFEALQTRPRLVIIEINQSVPWWMSVRQANLGGRFGTSAKAMMELAVTKGYQLIGAVGCNLILVVDEEAHHFNDYENSLEILFGHKWLTVMATDYAGHPRLLGANPPWGLQVDPSVEELVIREE